MENQKLGRNQGVLYNADTPLPVALTLLLAVASGSLGMVLPVVLLIIGMGFTPLSAAVAHHLGILRIGSAFTVAVVAAAPSLAHRPAAHDLVGPPSGRLKSLLAKRTAARRENHFLRGLFRVQPSGNQNDTVMETNQRVLNPNPYRYTE